MSARERVTRNTHEFWKATCGIDTHARGSGNARNDTPWVAFTADRKALVCTVWEDQIAKVVDPIDNRTRSFVMLGGKSTKWKGGAVKRGREAETAIDEALNLRVPVFGFRAVASGDDPAHMTRHVKHINLDNVSILKPHFGLAVDNPRERLGLEKKLQDLWKSPDVDALNTATLFELVEATGNVPGADWNPLLAPATGTDDAAGLRGNALAARIVLPYLVEHVRRQTDGIIVPLTYSDVAKLLGRVKADGNAYAQGIGNVLGEVTNLVEAGTRDWPEELRPPHITSMVVAKSGATAGLPSDGVNGYWPGFEALTPAEKRAKVRDEFDRILAYGDRWLQVLESVGLGSAASPADPDSGNGKDKRYGWGGGESEEHKQLRLDVLARPELFGLQNTRHAETEYPLLSGDRLDVFFRTEARLVGVEVKSIRSADDDLERGIYQCVKYLAVMRAQALIHEPAGTEIQVTAVLVVQKQLPADLEELATKLGVKWMVLPPGHFAQATPD
ncbi:hypothetical protein C8C99_4626 [Acidovorax sp. 107]|uniref:hypothetical protein n=1 Tax=Acidovorax sp. 107 TaxID=2135638 RepID=UPI000D3D7010|nr:hypothetical protein [Acidovorax sp. 107]PUA93412.1 hypothetical protein C8C99_4626 [Acidovorax sp. 107]